MTVYLIAALLVLAAAVNIGPEFASWLLGDSIRAWEYVAEGTQAAALWLIVLALLLPYLRKKSMRAPAVAVCSYGATEAALRPVCRLQFPMDKPPNVPAPEGLCAAAGWPWWWEISPFAVMLCATAVAVMLKGRP